MASQSITSQLFEAATLMLVGMVVVFLFLVLLIAGIKLIAAFCARFPGQEPQAPSRAPAAKQPPTNKSIDPAVLVAISAAIHQHRQNQ